MNKKELREDINKAMQDYLTVGKGFIRTCYPDPDLDRYLRIEGGYKPDYGYSKNND